MKVAVVGAGIVGASVAFRLAQDENIEVVVIDRDQPGNGTTSTSFAWLNANRKTPREYYEFNLAGMREHLGLPEELGEAPWLNPGGNLMWTTDEKELEELERRVRRLMSWGYRAEWRKAGEINKSLEPHVAFPTPETPVAYFPEEAWVDAPRLAKEFIRLAEKHGAETRFDAAVESAGIRDGRVATLRLERGENIPVDAVVNAAGPEADRVASMFGPPLPLARISGLLLRLAVSDEPISRLMHTHAANIRPDGVGSVLVHHDSIDQRLQRGEDEEALCAELLDRAQKLLPVLEDAEISGSTVGIRPVPEDGFSCVGSVSALPGYYEAVTHSGVTLGPLIGRLLAKEIVSGEVASLATPFSPDRFNRNIRL